MLSQVQGSGAGDASSAKARVTLAAVAEAASVSPAAVSWLLSGRLAGGATGKRGAIGIGPDAQKRILKACRDLDYRPRQHAALVRIYPEHGDLCFLSNTAGGSAPSNVYYSRMIQGVTSCLRDSSAHLSVGLFDGQVDYLLNGGELPRVIQSGTVSKYLLAGTPNYSLLMAIQQRDYAIVYLSRVIALPGVLSIVPDYFQAARLAIGRLVALGHRQIAVAGEHYAKPTEYSIQELTRGVLAATEEARLPFDPHAIIFSQEFNPVGADELVDAILKQAPRPTAVFCFDDWTGARVVRGALARGLRVPDDLSVIGCNDDAPATTIHPQLTTIHLPVEEMATRGVAELDRLIQESPPATPKRIVLPGRLIERESTRAI